MIRLLAALLLMTCHAATSRAQPTSAPAKTLGLSSQLCSEGWIALFDNETLFGWKPTGAANWTAKDGIISVDQGEHGFLNTTTQFANFELQLEYRCPSATNSGLFIRSQRIPKDPTADCYEINIAPADHPFPTGSLVARLKADAAPPTDDSVWHSLRIVADGARIATWVDGQPYSDYEDKQPLGRGHIGLQFRGGQIAFRKIRLKPLRLASLFNGKDLTGWTDAAADKSRFFVDEGELRVLNGRGQLETTASYGDFVLQLECKSHAEGLNSGIFFRCIPGDQMMGYESQIQNAMKDGDPNQPADCGTGGIFRRQNARVIVATDLTWFHKTIIADGAHIATWVNGHQVVDWTDERKAHRNPRKGLRLEPGSIMIQGHDPTTDLSFRNFHIAEIPAR
jgi:hypothetical protein